MDYCSGCGICTQVCPQGVHIAEINSQARARLKETQGVKLRDRVLARPTLAGRLGTPVAPLANWSLSNRLLRLVVEKTIGIHHRAPVPRFAGRTFQRWARSHAAPASPRRVAFFHGCGTNYYEPRLGEMTVALLEHNGLAVEVPKQDCCGLPLQSNGLFDDARGYVHRLAARLAPYARQGVDIVGTSTSCTLMLKREALEILGMSDDPDLQVVSERVFDICEYLLAMHERGELKTDFKPDPGNGHLPRSVPAAGPWRRQARDGSARAGSGAADGRVARLLLRGRRHVRAQAREVRHRHEGRRGAVRGGRGERFRRDRLRLRDLPLADRVCHRRALGAPGRDAPPGVGLVDGRSPVVGLVIVSHSAALAEGVSELAREMGGGEVAIEAAGGMEDGSIGTDAERVRAAVERVRSPDGVLILMDLGSALMSAEMATEMLDPDGGPIRLSEAPLVEGAVAAAALAGAGAVLDEVAREARGALRMKSEQLEIEEEDAEEAPSADDDGAGHDLRLRVENRLGLHARPAARFVSAVGGLDASVQVSNVTRSRGPADGRSLVGLATLAVGQGDEILVRASGPESEQALEALRALAADNFGDVDEDGDGPAPAAEQEPAAAAARGPVEGPAVARGPVEAPAAGTRLTGVPASPGISIGPARRLPGAGARGGGRPGRHPRRGACAAGRGPRARPATSSRRPTRRSWRARAPRRPTSSAPMCCSLTTPRSPTRPSG